jgi:hypothetical protein
VTHSAASDARKDDRTAQSARHAALRREGRRPDCARQSQKARHTLATRGPGRFLCELANLRPGQDSLRRFKRLFHDVIPPHTPAFAVETVPFRDRRVSAHEDATANEGPDDPTSQVSRSKRRREARIEATAHALKTRKYAAHAGQASRLTTPVAMSVSAEASQNSTGPGIPQLKLIEPEAQEAQWIWHLRQMLRRVWEQPDRWTREWGAHLLLLTTYAEAKWRHVSILGIDGPLPEPTPFEQALMYLVNMADRARVCQNSDCAAPYFFAARRSQKYCSTACALPAQREFKRRWWAEHGAKSVERRSHRGDRIRRTRKRRS